MASLTRSLELLGSAVSYALASARPVTPEDLARPTPCAGWDLASLLWHTCDSAGVLYQAVTGGEAGPVPARSEAGPGPDPVGEFRRRAAGLSAACAADQPGDQLVAVGDRELTVSMAATVGAIEITVHGWDISVACGRQRPIPPGLAAVLLAVAPLFITPASRAGLFAAPVPVPAQACPGDRLVAFLGRQPRPLAAPG